MKSRRTFIKQLGTTGLGLLAPFTLQHCSGLIKHPNFILIVADDMGWDDLSLHGNPYVQTPALDKLARESVRFVRYNVNPVCAPSRASLLTGRHFLRTGVSHVHGGKDFIASNETTFADILKKQGYVMGMWGKWHSGKTDGYYPWQRGFDQAYMARLYQHENSEGLYNGKLVKHPEKWTTDVITDYAIQFMEQHQHDHFFAYLPLLSCHAPLAARKENIQKYKAQGLSQGLATIYAMVERIDRNVDRLMTRLKELHLENDTIVIFMSDNGPAIINNDLTDADREIRYVNKMRGHKGNVWENGVRSPLFIRWKGHFSPSVVKRLVDATDMFPTILQLAGIHHSSSLPLDGRSFKPYLYGETQSLPPKLSFNYAAPGWPPTDKPWTPEGVHDEYRPVAAGNKAEKLPFDEQIISVQKEQYKLLHNPGQIKDMPPLVDGYALFDMEKDPRQLHNIIDEHPKLAETLKTELANWWASIIKDKHSFAMPVFHIGLDGRTENQVLAYGAQQVSDGAVCAAFYLTLPGAGEYAEYKIHVHTPGNYAVNLGMNTAQTSGAEIKLSVAGQNMIAKVTDANSLELGNVKLGKGEQLLRLEVVNADQDGLALEKISELEIIRRG